MSLWVGMALGGVTLSGLGSGSSFFIENKAPTLKGVFRDFLIGAILVAFIMQLLPESASSLIGNVVKFIPMTLPKLALDEEVRVGVPGF